MVGEVTGALFTQPQLAIGDTVACPQCSGQHVVQGSRSTGAETNLLLLYTCGGELRLAGVFGRSMMKVTTT